MSANSAEVSHDSVGLCTKEELVTFTNVLSQYAPASDVTIRYTLGSRVRDTDLDWIGIFQSGWREISRPLTFQWAPIHGTMECQPRERSATFPGKLFEPLQHPTNTYQVVYVHGKSKVIGISPSFLVTEAARELENVTSATAGPCDHQVTNGEAGSSKTDSPVLLSSDDEWDFHTYHSQNTSETSFSDLSDIADLATSASKIPPKEKPTLEIVEGTKRNESNINDTSLGCTAHEVQLINLLSDQSEKNQNLETEYNIPANELEIIESNSVFTGPEPRNILTNTLTNNESTKLAVKICSEGHKEVEIKGLVEQGQNKCNELNKLSNKVKTEKKVRDISNHTLEDPVTSLMLQQGEVTKTESCSGNDESSSHVPKNEINFSGDRNHVNSANHDFHMANLFALKRKTLFNLSVPYQFADKAAQREIRRKKLGRRRKSESCIKRKEFSLIRKITRKRTRTISFYVNQKKVPAQKSLINFSVKTNNDVYTPNKSLGDLGLLKNINKVSTFEKAKSSDEEFPCFNSKQNEQKSKYKNNRINIVDTVVQFSTGRKKLMRPSMELDFGLSKQNKKCFTNKSEVDSLSGRIASELKEESRKPITDSVNYMTAKGNGCRQNQKESQTNRMRLHVQNGASEYTKVVGVLDSYGELKRNRLHGDNTHERFHNHEGRAIDTVNLPASSGQSSQELASPASSPGYPRVLEVKADVERRQENEMSDEGSENESKDESEEYFSSSPRDNALPPSSRAVVNAQCYKDDGLKKSTYLNAGILERIKHHLSQCQEETRLDKDLVKTSCKEVSTWNLGSKLAELPFPKPSNQIRGYAGETSTRRDLLKPTLTFNPTWAAGTDDAKEIQFDRGSTGVKASGLLQDGGNEGSIKPISWASSAGTSKDGVSQEGNNRFFHGFIFQGSNNSLAKKKFMNLRDKFEKGAIQKLKNIKSQKDLKNKLMKNKQTLNYKKAQEFEKKIQNRMLDRKFVLGCSGSVQNTSTETKHTAVHVVERLGKLPAATESLKTTECSERLGTLPGPIGNSEKSSLSLFWPLPTFLTSSLSFGTWITLTDSTGHSRLGDEDTRWPLPTFVKSSQSFRPWTTQTDLSDHVHPDDKGPPLQAGMNVHIQETSNLCSNKILIPSLARDPVYKGFVGNKEATSEVEYAKINQIVTSQDVASDQMMIPSPAGNNEDSLSAELGSLKKMSRSENRLNQSGDCVRKEETHKRNNLRIKSVRHRRIGLLKCAGDYKHRIRSNAEIHVLRSKVASSDQQIKDLTVQLAALKEALNIKSRTAERVHLICPELKKMATSQTVNQKYCQVAEPRSYVKRSIETIGDFASSVAPCKRRRITRKLTICPKHKPESNFWKPESDFWRTWRTALEPSSNHDLRHHCKMSATPCLEKTSNSATIICSHTKESQNQFSISPDVTATFRMSGFPAAYNSGNETTFSDLQNSWACSHPGLSTTSCYPSPMPSYFDQLLTKTSTPPHDSPFNYHQSQERAFQLATPCSHRSNKSTHQHLPLNSRIPSLSSPTEHSHSVLSHHRISDSKILHNNIHNPISQTSCSCQHHSPPRQISFQQLPMMHSQFNALSCNNSRNKSSDSSATNYEEVVSPLSSPGILPASNIPSSTAHMSPEQSIAEYARTSLNPKIIVHPCRNQIENTPLTRYSHQGFYKHSDASSSRTNIFDSSLYWPSESINKDQPDFKSIEMLTTPYSSLQNKYTSTEGDNAAKIKVRITPFNISENSPDSSGNEKIGAFAFASGATVCEKSSHGHCPSGGLYRWLKSMGDGHAGTFLTRMSYNHLLIDDKQEGGLPKPGSNIPRPIPQSDDEAEPFLSQFQSCYLRHLEQDESQQKHHLELQKQHHRHKEYQQNPSQLRLKQSNQYAYRRSLLSMPPSELPFPPLSPFHHSDQTKVIKTSSESETEQLTLNDLLHQSIAHNAHQGSFLLDSPCLVQPGGPTFSATSLLKNTNPDLNMFSQNSTNFENSYFPLDLSLNRFKGLSSSPQNVRFVSQFNGQPDTQQIEASATCNGTTQR